ncbi:MAG: asparaginyl-tRNA synthetase [Saprospiraceae bacterium]|jgi:asparaginyl-tRNA synthetase|tara:strand:- start:999 stop:2447 length:1449 start_codon:yes stop_codon:yes gene_type:complete
MAKRTKVAEILAGDYIGQELTVAGWVRSFRSNRFIALNDGSTIKTLQLVIDFENEDPEVIKLITVGAAVKISGKIVESQGRGQTVELIASEIKVLGVADAEQGPGQYPLQPKKHSLEYLREIAHLRFRTNTFGAIFRIRHHVAFAIHEFFHNKGFLYMHSPIITGSDAEGAGEMFKVTNFDIDNTPKGEDGKVDFGQDFFGKATNLTVSGQLEAELAALAFSEVYTFGPTFRAENSHTSRHLAEFWMIEPEVAFADLNDNMDLAEEMLKYVIKSVLDRCGDDLDFLENRLIEEEKVKPTSERSPMPLKEKLQFCVDTDFERVTYTRAIDILKNCKPNKKGKFQFKIEEWGTDLQSEHERFLVEKHFKKPVILTDYPKDIKAFYMRMNDDGNTVGAMDILFPGIGEIVGGSQREERLDVLLARMKEMDIHEDEMSWFLDTRRFGTCPHAGFGLGFERLILFVTGMANIRDVIPFPRFPGSAEF